MRSWLMRTVWPRLHVTKHGEVHFATLQHSALQHRSLLHDSAVKSCRLIDQLGTGSSLEQRDSAIKVKTQQQTCRTVGRGLTAASFRYRIE